MDTMESDSNKNCLSEDEKNKKFENSEGVQKEIKEKENKQTNLEKNKKKHKKTNERSSKVKQKRAWLWVIKVFIITLVTSSVFSLLSEILMSYSSIIVSFLIVLAIIIISIIFDIIGVSATACSIEPYLAMASRKIKGAKMAVKLVQNNEKVSSICADVIGDICGIVSGAAGAAIALRLFSIGTTWAFVGGIIVSSVIAALTVGGKAIGKNIAVAKCQSIVFFVAKILSIFSRKK